MMRYFGWDGMMGYGGWFGMFIMMAFWLVILGGGAYLIFKALQKGNGTGAVELRESPLDILKRRYAAGEINSEEFEKIKRELQ